MCEGSITPVTLRLSLPAAKFLMGVTVHLIVHLNEIKVLPEARTYDPQALHAGAALVDDLQTSAWLEEIEAAVASALKEADRV